MQKFVYESVDLQKFARPFKMCLMCIQVWPQEFVCKFVQKSRCAKFCIFAAKVQICKVCSTCMQVWLWEFVCNYMQKIVYESVDVQNFASPQTCKMCSMCMQLCWSLFAKMCAKVQMCEISHVHTRMKCVRCACRCGCWSLFAKMCAKGQMCEISHVHTRIKCVRCECMCVQCACRCACWSLLAKV